MIYFLNWKEGNFHVYLTKFSVSHLFPVTKITSCFFLQNVRLIQVLATTRYPDHWSGWKIPQLGLQMQISRKCLHTPLVEKMLLKLEHQRVKERNLQLTTQVSGAESLEAGTLGLLCPLLAPFRKVGTVLYLKDLFLWWSIVAVLSKISYFVTFS